MRVENIVRLLLPLFAAFVISKSGWLYALWFQRDQPITPFQKTVTKYASLLVLGICYVGLWQYEIDAAFHLRSAWQGLLVVWLVVTVWFAVRALRHRPTTPPDGADSISASAIQNR